jgi:hypothetical protein
LFIVIIMKLIVSHNAPLTSFAHALFLGLAEACWLRGSQVMSTVAVDAQVLLVTTVLLQERTRLAASLRVKDASQGCDVAFLVQWDVRIQNVSGFMILQVLTRVMLVPHSLRKLCQHLTYFSGNMRLMVLV